MTAPTAELPTDPEELRTHCQRLQTLITLSRRLADSASSLEERLGACVAELARLTRAEKASLMLLEGEELVVKAATNPRLLGMATPLGQPSISTRVAASGEAFYAKDLAESAGAGLSRQGELSTYRTASLISLPLKEDGRVLGVLNLSDKAGAEFFTEADLALAASIAEQVAAQVLFSALHGRLENAYRELNRTQRAKDDLLHLIFHDMKAPLTGAKEVLSLLLVQPELPSGERDQLLGLAQCELELLWRRVSNLLDLNRMDADQFPLSPAPLDLGTLTREAVARLAVVARYGLVEVAVESEGPVEAVLDEDLVERMLVNLLANAITAASPDQGGGGRVMIRVKPAGRRVRVEVEDDGRGVDPALGQGIFERYAQGREGRGSTGLGLYFCRRAAWLVGGEVGYQNLSPAGACFYLNLPRRAGEEA